MKQMWPHSALKYLQGQIQGPQPPKDSGESTEQTGFWPLNFTLAKVVDSEARVHVSPVCPLPCSISQCTIRLIQVWGLLAYHSIMAIVKVRDSIGGLGHTYIILRFASDSYSPQCILMYILIYFNLSQFISFHAITSVVSTRARKRRRNENKL